MTKPATTKKTMLSAVQPTSRPHIGNYLGAVKNWVRLQEDYNCIFFAVDLHAITMRMDPKELREQTKWMIAFYIAAGIDPTKALLFVQSHVPEHAELGWIMTCYSTMGELSRMTQYKDKSAKAGESIPTGLFVYPTLMAADILLYGTHLVPVGGDQKQHVELTRDIAERMNNLYGKDTFVMPEPYIPTVGARIMSLTEPTSKMSKSNPDLNHAIYLTDTDDQILKKLKRATTDSGTEIAVSDDKPGVSNLLSIQSAILGKPIAELVAGYAGKQYGHLKLETADIIISALKPIREKTSQILAEPGYLDQVLKQGAEQARAKARVTLERVYERIGFIPAQR